MHKPYNAIFLLALMILPAIAVAEGDDITWNTVLKSQFFAGKNIDESNAVIELDAPYRAEDPAIVPVKVTSKFAQSKDKYIKKIWLFVDKNPFPFVGEFEFFPESGKADLALRVRVNTYSDIRAVAETNDGKFSMTKKFVKASGGCSAPIGADLDEAMKRLGKVKFRLDDGIQSGQPALTQLMISHPNLTGMQMDQMTRFIRKSHFIDQLKVTFNDKPVLNAKIDIAISADPNFRFYFVPDKAGELKAEFTDVSCESPTSRNVCNKGGSYSQSYTVSP
ncbi:quinoprotein dehydrogenase-associated SoxYZ-like carrier [Methylomonas sp. LW13]|uniref:quinoprotein dehydrogenase-associated SoxYZ-like carrier n=1 Tax=unclassified Methylomonas TaxID=2608980 RepID=UPI00051C760D|nr:MULTISPECIES: quinoprotein dehydrogenase-associated SoxYZ-like carrier [unclassified Methylomonas]PKD38723.1 quinoprotein dehydrogenase-associated SoxYZ-like carrier [Methylomonas sp. Kb3]QBC28487.1 quinoprotein dehydrogenase-associated SoxYZ-like carrier [Methylomonas sp. LW13]